MKERILIIEDEENIRNILAYNFKNAGYEPITAPTGEEGFALATQKPRPDLILLDIMLPGMTGIEVCRRIREVKHCQDIPIIMLTARGEEVDRLMGFEMGADDYVVKPFSVRELLYRTRVFLKRSQNFPEQSSSERVVFGVLEVDAGSHKVWVEGSEVDLSAMEFRLLEAFLSRKGRVQSRDTLLNDVWGIDAFIQTRTVDVHVKQLRKKLGVAGAYIETVRGVGYRMLASLNGEG